MVTWYSEFDCIYKVGKVQRIMLSTSKDIWNHVDFLHMQFNPNLGCLKWKYSSTENTDDMRRKGTLSPQNVPSTICTSKRPHVDVLRRITSTHLRFAVWTFCGVTMPVIKVFFLRKKVEHKNKKTKGNNTVLIY